MKLSVAYEKRACLRIDKESGGFSDGNTFAGWAIYVWRDDKSMWVCKENNEGFHDTSGLAWELSDRDMTLISLGARDESE